MGVPSVAKLQGVHEDLVKVVHAAYDIMASKGKVVFTVTEGLRSIERQKQLVASGASKTMDSRHITGHAVDLAATLGGVVRWDWPLYFQVADAMKQASLEFAVPITWGGAWDKVLDAYTQSAEAECSAYVARRQAQGNKHPFIDGPHFELLRSKYPA